MEIGAAGVRGPGRRGRKRSSATSRSWGPGRPASRRRAARPRRVRARSSSTRTRRRAARSTGIGRASRRPRQRAPGSRGSRPRARLCEAAPRSSTSSGEATGFRVLAEAGQGSVLVVHARALVLATGARELFLPFPGWTLPGVMGAGGAQAMKKMGADLRGRTAVVAGSGPAASPGRGVALGRGRRGRARGRAGESHRARAVRGRARPAPGKAARGRALPGGLLLRAVPHGDVDRARRSGGTVSRPSS